MNKKQRQEMLEIFSEGFHEVVIPYIDGKIETLGNKVDEGFGKLDRKITNVTDFHATTLDEHEKRLKTLETKVFSR
ncbi:MAG TPA: hypothetical protein VIH52_03480 [Candidatus Nanoarchaeia archaeon]|nr:hypothetical protein [uncultured archaeon]